jgi:hypothetical protein
VYQLPTEAGYTRWLAARLSLRSWEGPGRRVRPKPWRLQALAFKAVRRLYPDYPLWRDFPYEYVLDKLAIDVINGGPGLREWVDNPASTPADLDALAGPDEAAWREVRAPWLLY